MTSAGDIGWLWVDITYTSRWNNNSTFAFMLNETNQSAINKSEMNVLMLFYEECVIFVNRSPSSQGDKSYLPLFSCDISHITLNLGRYPIHIDWFQFMNDIIYKCVRWGFWMVLFYVVLLLCYKRCILWFIMGINK